VKRRLGLLSDQAVDPAMLLPIAERRELGRRTIGLVTVVPADPFVDALLEALPHTDLLSAAPDASADEIDALVAEAERGEGAVVIACGEAVVGRVKADLCIAIDGGRHLADLPAAFRSIRDESQLILSEPRLGTAKALAAMIQRADA
jgi:hypothetical protein